MSSEEKKESYAQEGLAESSGRLFCRRLESLAVTADSSRRRRKVRDRRRSSYSLAPTAVCMERQGEPCFSWSAKLCRLVAPRPCRCGRPVTLLSRICRSSRRVQAGPRWHRVAASSCDSMRLYLPVTAQIQLPVASGLKLCTKVKGTTVELVTRISWTKKGDADAAMSTNCSVLIAFTASQTRQYYNNNNKQDKPKCRTQKNN